MGVAVIENFFVWTVSSQNNSNSSQKYRNYSGLKNLFCKIFDGREKRWRRLLVVTILYVAKCTNFSEAVVILLSSPSCEEVFGRAGQETLWLCFP